MPASHDLSQEQQTSLKTTKDSTQNYQTKQGDHLSPPAVIQQDKQSKTHALTRDRQVTTAYLQAVHKWVQLLSQDVLLLRRGGRSQEACGEGHVGGQEHGDGKHTSGRGGWNRARGRGGDAVGSGNRGRSSRGAVCLLLKRGECR
jgi:hypothetical protein